MNRRAAEHGRLIRGFALLLAATAGSPARAEPAVRVIKTVSVLWDPINGEVNPKSIPGALIRSVIKVENQGDAPLADSTLVVVDHITHPLQLQITGFARSGGSPIAVADGDPTSNLRFAYAGLQNSSDDIDFSNDGGVTWTYAPSPDADGVDCGITNVRVHPRGGMAAHSSFALELRYRLP